MTKYNLRGKIWWADSFRNCLSLKKTNQLISASSFSFLPRGEKEQELSLPGMCSHPPSSRSDAITDSAYKEPFLHIQNAWRKQQFLLINLRSPLLYKRTQQMIQFSPLKNRLMPWARGPDMPLCGRMGKWRGALSPFSSCWLLASSGAHFFLTGTR